jgi:hypothetical protein
MKKNFYVLFLFCLISSVASRAALTANFSVTDTFGCSPISLAFTDLSTGSPTSWAWKVTGPATLSLREPNLLVYNARYI